MSTESASGNRAAFPPALGRGPGSVCAYRPLLIAKFEEACDAVGRDPREIRRSLQFDWDGKDRSKLIDLSGSLLELGITEQVVYVRGDQPVELAEKIGETLPELRRLQKVHS